MYNLVLMKIIKKLKIILPIIGLLLIAVAVILEITIKSENKGIISSSWATIRHDKIESTKIIIPTETITPTLAPTATPTPITVEEMNKSYGPCVKVNVLMYHHIQEEEIAKKNKQTNLTVTPEFFRKHLQYLKDNGYSVITVTDLKNFFDNGVALPKKSAMITLDDGYKDNHDIAYPILKEFGFRAMIFTATGLLENNGYMSWSDLNEMKDLVYFANHTWSHHSSAGTKEKLTEEITLADRQLADHGLNSEKIFAYPYGASGKTDEEILKANGYEIAFTTTHGNILCKGKSLELPRIRVGNAPLKSYGL
jgi:peptidoglycan/xylan/chitin deacetylase (PgdA/CDA1 family)